MFKKEVISASSIKEGEFYIFGNECFQVQKINPSLNSDYINIKTVKIIVVNLDRKNVNMISMDEDSFAIKKCEDVIKISKEYYYLILRKITLLSRILEILIKEE